MSIKKDIEKRGYIKNNMYEIMVNQPVFILMCFWIIKILY